MSPLLLQDTQKSPKLINVHTCGCPHARLFFPRSVRVAHPRLIIIIHPAGCWDTRRILECNS